MTRLEQLICTLCPQGVEYKSLKELGCFFGGLSGKSKDDFTNGNAKFITYKNVYSNPALQIDVADKVKISADEKQHSLQYGDVIFTGSSETPDECGFSSVVTIPTEEKLYLNSFCFFFRFNDSNIILPDFAKHLFRSSNLRRQIIRTASGVTRFNVSKRLMGDVIIPLPPLEVQQEIVRILDQFTELTAELTARKEQYKYYSLSLLNKANDTKRVPLSSLGTWCGGCTPSMANPAFWSNGKIPWVSSKDMKAPWLADTQDHITQEALTQTPIKLLPKNSVAIVARSGILKHTLPVVFIPFETTVNQDIKALTVSQYVDPRYAYHIINANSSNILQKAKKQGGTVDSLDIQKFMNYLVPLPPLPE